MEDKILAVLAMVLVLPVVELQLLIVYLAPHQNFCKQVVLVEIIAQQNNVFIYNNIILFYFILFIVVNGASCSNCDQSCTSCNGATATSCLSCSGSTYLTATKTCSATCPSGTCYFIKINLLYFN